MRVAIVDDERPARNELKYQLQELEPSVEITEGESGADALRISGEFLFDIMFLDINLGDIPGTALIKALHNMQPEMKIVFVTAYSEYAVEAFELEVTDYIMKPFSQRRLKKTLEKCMGEKKAKIASVSQKRIAINVNGKTIFEDIDHIVYIETYNRGCKIHTEEEEYLDHHSIGDYEKRLEKHGFFRCHKSYLIKTDKVKEVFPWGNNSYGIRMQKSNGEILPVGRDKAKTLKQILGC